MGSRDPHVSKISKGNNLEYMPSVISYIPDSKNGYKIECFGEDAENLISIEGKRTVISNVKRWALTSDPYISNLVERKMQDKKQKDLDDFPPEWNRQTRNFDLFGHDVSVRQVIQDIIAEALKRAKLDSPQFKEAEVKLACPVESDYLYRNVLVEAVSNLGFKSKISWVTQEPLLFAELLRAKKELDPGNYLVYDFGGGSFDCAIITVEDIQGTKILTVQGAEGDPVLGGSNIDKRLAERLKLPDDYNYKASLRFAKESLCDSPTQNQIALPGAILRYTDILAVLKENHYFERSMQSVKSAYYQAKLFWKRPDNAEPFGIRIDSGRYVTQLNEQDLAADIDKVFLLGGTTKVPIIREKLEKIFGPNKIITSSALPALNAIYPNIELTGVALGASCSSQTPLSAIYVNRVPGHIILETKQNGIQQKREYIPYTRLPISSAINPYVSEVLEFNTNKKADYKLEVKDVDGITIQDSGWQNLLMSYGCPVAKVQIIVDRFGLPYCHKTVGKEDMLREMMEIIAISRNNKATTSNYPIVLADQNDKTWFTSTSKYCIPLKVKLGSKYNQAFLTDVLKDDEFKNIDLIKTEKAPWQTAKQYETIIRIQVLIELEKQWVKRGPQRGSHKGGWPWGLW